MKKSCADPAYFYLLIEAFGNNEKNAPPEVLQQAIGLGNLEMVQLLIQQGFSHPQALTLAIQEHNSAIFTFLLEAGFMDQEALIATVDGDELAMLRAMVERNGLSATDSAAMKKRAIELSRTKILSYLLTL